MGDESNVSRRSAVSSESSVQSWGALRFLGLSIVSIVVPFVGLPYYRFLIYNFGQSKEGLQRRL